MDKFSMDEKTLDLHIFTPEEPKLGPYTSLNINYLPYLASHIMHKISHKEFCSLIEFELQTFLLELAIQPQKSKTIKELTTFIIREMRLTPKFWIHSSEAWMEVHLRLKLLHTLEPNCSQEIVKKAGGKKSLAEILQDAHALRKYIAFIDFSKLDYKSDFLKVPEVAQLVEEYDQANQQNKQLQAIDTYNEVIQTMAEAKNKKYQFKFLQHIDQVKSQQIDLMSRVAYCPSKETRSTKTDQVSYRDRRVMIKEQQRLDVDEKRTIFVPNQVNSYNKIDLIILPYIYRFIFGDNCPFTGNHLRVQNLILYLCLSDQENYKQNKQKKNVILDDNAESKTTMKLFQKYLDQSKDRLMVDFEQYCRSNNISLVNYFSSTPASYRKELLLIRNILMISLKFAQKLLGIQYQFNDQKVSQLEYDDEEKNDKSLNTYQKWNKTDLQNDYYYFNVLAQLELYYDIPLDQFDDLLRVYISYIEIVYTSKKEHFKEYFGVLKTNQDGILGLKSSIQSVNNAIEQYLTYINAPKTQQKRSYIYHSDKREEWKEEQYKQFLEGLYKYFEIVVNNRKIAKYMGDVNPNHVRFIKGQYLRGLKKRAREKNINRKELLKQDIENFDISIFEKK